MTVGTVKPGPRLTDRLINGVLGIQPLFNLMRQRARTMMMRRAESLGIHWEQEVQALLSRGGSAAIAPEWEQDLAAVTNPAVRYPDYYLKNFHAYDEGNLGWLPAAEEEVAAYAVHSRLWPDAGVEGDARMRRSYHEVLQAQIAEPPRRILDLGCGVGMNAFALQQVYPEAEMTGLDLSPYFLAIARYQAQRRQQSITWVHAPAEATGLPDQSFDLVSTCLMFHELPQEVSIAIFKEARRLLRPGGHLAIMDMNPHSEVYAKMPPFILTLLKSTEPYLDSYFALNMEQAIEAAGFTRPTRTFNTSRHVTLVAQAI